MGNHDPTPIEAQEPGQSRFASVETLRKKLLILFFLSLPLMLLTANPAISVVAHLVLIVFTLLLWSPNRPPILYFGWAMQWLQCSIAIYFYDILEFPLRDVPLPYFEEASWAALFCSMSLGVGIWFASSFRLNQRTHWNPELCRLLSLPKLFSIYALLTSLSGTLQYIAWSTPSLTQFFLAFNNGRWAALFLLFLTILVQQRGYLLLFGVFFFELFSGFMGFFGEFKSVLYALLIAVLSLGGRRMIVWLVFPVIIAGVSLAIVWSAVKMEYRRFLNKDSSQQVVLVSTGEKIDRLSMLVAKVDSEKIATGLEATVNRIAYVEFMGKAMAYVPASTPHENGALWMTALKHVLLPRFLNPNKASLDDSEITRKYTGYRIGGRNEGTSIGLGYVAESYVDFGPIWMNAPCFAVGLWLGFLYRFFTLKRFFMPLGAGFLFISIALNASQIEISGPKLLGTQLMLFIVFWPIGQLLSKQLSQRGGAATESSEPV